MAVQLNHTIVWSRDARASAAFLCEVLGLEPARRFGPFMVVEMGNGVSLDYHDHQGEIASQHYAFLVSEEEFDGSFARLVERGLDYWADPALRRQGAINRNDGGRGVYFRDLDGHLLELLTRPYGSGG